MAQFKLYRRQKYQYIEISSSNRKLLGVHVYIAHYIKYFIV